MLKYMPNCLLHFIYFFVDLDLKFEIFSLEDVKTALDECLVQNPSIFLVPDTNENGVPEKPDEIENYDVVSSEPPKKRKKTNSSTAKYHNLVKDCLLYDKTEGKLMYKALSKYNLTWLECGMEYGDCFYQAVLANIATPTIDQQVYTAEDLKLQICMHMIRHPDMSNKVLKLRLQSEGTCLFYYIEKIMQPKQWGENWLLYIIHHMWGLKGSILSFGNDSVLESHYSIHQPHTSAKDADIVLIYNGHNHFSGTGNPPFLFVLLNPAYAFFFFFFAYFNFKFFSVQHASSIRLAFINHIRV